MVGRFNVRNSTSQTSGTGDAGETATGLDWLVFDNSAQGNRGSGLSEDAAHRLAADLELQYDVYGPRPAHHVRKVDPPVPVERAGGQDVPAGFLDAWVFEHGAWIGRVKDHNRYTWIPGSQLRPAGQF